MKYNNAQFSAIEIILVIMLFAFSSLYFIKPITSTEQDYKTNIDSALDAIYYNESFRDLFMNENLAVSYKTLDWSNFNSTISKMFNNYEFVLGNSTVSKTIYECSDSYYNKYFSERIITIRNDSKYEFRKIRLGVCY